MPKSWNLTCSLKYDKKADDDVSMIRGNSLFGPCSRRGRPNGIHSKNHDIKTPLVTKNE